MLALSAAIPRCRLVTCDAFMADVVRRAALDVEFGCELFTGRRADVVRLAITLEARYRPFGRLGARARAAPRAP